MVNQVLRIGGWGNANLSISQPLSGAVIQCPPGRSRSSQEQISISITAVRYDAGKNLYDINIRYSKAEENSDCPNKAERSITLRQTFEWLGKPIDFRMDDDFQVKLVP